MSKKKTGIVIVVLLLLLAVCAVAYQMLFSASGWEDYAETDEYINLCDYKTTIETDRAQDKTQDDIWTDIVAFSQTVKYPQKELDELKQENLENYTQLANNSGYADVYEFLEKEMSMTAEQFDENSEFFCKQKITEKLVLYRIAALEGVEFDEEAYSAYLEDVKVLNGFTDESFVESYGMTFREYADEAGMKDTYMLELVQKAIFE